jgi:hypothetical protein
MFPELRNADTLTLPGLDAVNAAAIQSDIAERAD